VRTEEKEGDEITDASSKFMAIKEASPGPLARVRVVTSASWKCNATDSQQRKVALP
jgi:hypothetical protein